MKTASVRRLQHVSITRPQGSAAQTRHFYGEILGLPEITPPETLREFDLIWYRLGSDELHLVAEESPINAGSGRHLCIEVDDLDAWRERLTKAGVDIQEAPPIPGRPRFFVVDPFQNGIELTELQS